MLHGSHEGKMTEEEQSEGERGRRVELNCAWLEDAPASSRFPASSQRLPHISLASGNKPMTAVP
jgi:hypothetical protein